MSYTSKKSKFIASTITAAVVASAVAPAAGFAASDFKDVPADSLYADYVNALAKADIIDGRTDGTFDLGGKVNRAEASKMVANILKLDTKKAPVANFKDVDQNKWYAEFINALYAEKLINGKGAGKFEPTATLTRGEFAKMVVEAYDLELNTKGPKANFKDVAGDKWYADYIEILFSHELVSGTTATTFSPNAPIKRADFAKLLTQTDWAVGSTLEKPDAEKVIESVQAVADITVNEGEEVVLPKTVKVTYADKTTEDVAVDWNTSKIDFAKVGTYNVTGTIEGTDKTASVKVVVKAVAPEVVSVSAANAGELVVKFNKAIKESTVITNPGTDDTLVNGVIELNGASTVDGNNAELSKDGKTLTIYGTSGAVTKFDGAYTFELKADSVKSTDDKFVKAYSTTFSIKDETRASITGVKQVSKYVFDITLSEPVQSTGAVTAKYADGEVVTVDSNPLRDNNKTIRVTLNGATEANKEISISVAALSDLNSNVSAPVSTKVTVTDADKVKPTVVSAAATSTTEVRIKFSEALLSVDDTKVKLNGTTVGTGNAVIDNKDNTVLVVAVSAQTTSAALSLDAGAVTDLSGNSVAAWNQVVSFKADATAPVLNSTKVVKKADGFNYLQLQFSEKVQAPAGGFTNLTFKYQDEFGVTQPVIVPLANVAVDTDDATIVNVKLEDNAGTPAKLKENVDFKVKFAKGYVTDLFSNELAEKEITFTNNGTASDATLRLASGTPITNGVSLTDGAYIDVAFASAVDPTTAKNAANYAVEGATVTKAELTSNSASGAIVRVFLKDGSVEATGNYNVTVKGVKGFYSNVKEMDVETKNISINENVRATVKSQAINFTGSATTLAVTFTEALLDTADTLGAATATNDFSLYVDGKEITSVTVSGDADLSTAAAVVTFTITDDLAQEIADGKSIKLVAKDSLDLKDAAGNKVNVAEIIIK